jgi:hypothetical protein
VEVVERKDKVPAAAAAAAALAFGLAPPLKLSSPNASSKCILIVDLKSSGFGLRLRTGSVSRASSTLIADI